MASDSNGNGKKPSKKSAAWTPERRQRQSEIVKQRIAEGKMGPKFGHLGGRPPKSTRAAELVTKAAQEEENAKKIIEVFKDAIHPNQPMGLRLRGAELWLNVEREEAKLAIQQADHEAKQMGRDELLAHLVQKLTGESPTANLLRAQLEQENIQDAEVVEVADDGDA